MKDDFLLLAKYNREKNRTIYSILDKMSNEDRKKERGSYYGSLSGLFRHIIESTHYTLGRCKMALKNNGGVQKALVPLDGISLPNDSLCEAQWKSLESALETIENSFANFIGALEDGDLKAPVKIDWYDGNPADVPLSFMLHNLSVHGTHHRGQISQILDELKIDNDYSGLNVQFLAD
jgi:uncharacterized damage-inducible protein DinB